MSEETKTAMKTSVWKYLGSLFMEEKNGQQAMSLGRVAFLALFIQAMWIWTNKSAQEDLPPHMIETLWGLLAYITVGKIPSFWRKKV